MTKTHEIYENDKLIGCSKLSQAKIGFIWGGNSYSQIIFLQNKEILNERDKPFLKTL